MVPFAYDLDALNLDAMTREDLIQVAVHLQTLADYARRKAAAMTLRERGQINAALGLEADCDGLYSTLPGPWRW